MTPQSSVVEFDEVAAGPFAISRLPLAGLLAALGFLASAALAVRGARRAGLPVARVLEAHAIGAPVAVLAAQALGLQRSFPGFLHDARVLATALLEPACLPCGATALAALALFLAWASGDARGFLDALAPGAVILGAAAAASRCPLLPAGLILAGGLALALILARGAMAPGRSALIGWIAAGAAVVVPLVVGR